MENSLTLTAKSSVIVELAALARDHDVLTSEPELLNMDGALNAGLTAEDARQALEVITLLFKAGASVLAFLTATRAFLRDRDTPAALTVRDGDGRIKGRLDAHTPNEDLVRLAAPSAGAE